MTELSLSVISNASKTQSLDGNERKNFLSFLYSILFQPVLLLLRELRVG
jgi:hypothetical protein